MKKISRFLLLIMIMTSLVGCKFVFVREEVTKEPTGDAPTDEIPTEVIPTEDVTTEETPDPQITYIITFNHNGYGEKPDSVNASSLPNPLPELSAEDFIFEGWYYDSEFDKKAVAGETITDNITLYAKWVQIIGEISYSVTFENNGHGEKPAKLFNVSVLPNPLPELSAEGWVFEGWYKDIALTTRAVAGEAFTDNITLYAKWSEISSYKVTFENNGHGNSVLPLFKVTALPDSLPKLKENGYNFEGWYFDSEFTIPAFANAKISKDVTLYAKWSEILSYKVTFENNNHGYDYGSIENVTHLPSILPVLVEEGYEFDGWYFDSEFAKLAVGNTKLTSNVTLYAKWKELKYQITYNVNGHGIQPQDVKDVNKLPEKLPVLSEEGFIFEGWFTNVGLTVSAVTGAPVAKNTTLYARWTEIAYTISFNINGHGTALNPINKAKTIPSNLPTLLDNGWIFEGWYTDSSLTTPVVSGSQLLENITLYAKWREVSETDGTFTITFNNNGYGETPTEINNVTSLPAKLPILTSDDAEFIGWFKDSELTIVAISGSKINSDTVLYAKWSTAQTTFSVSFAVNGFGKDINTLTGLTALPTPLPTLYATGYEFIGWYTDEELTDKAQAGATITSDTVLYAKWQAENASGDEGEKHSVTPPFTDTMKTNPVYNGEDVLVSRIETTSAGTHILVDNKPFLFIGTSIRVDAFMNCDKFNYQEVEALFNEASKLGVTCVQVPVEWAKMEVEKDVFDYTYIFTMLYYANKYNLKIELLWYGTNMCGDTHSYTVPDYILSDGRTYPKLDALRTGEFWNYYGIMWFLDFDNPNLIAREVNAINKMMEYIYEFDSTHGGKKPVIGIQVLNEPDIFARWRVNEKNVLSNETGQVFTADEAFNKIANSLDALGKAVKANKYKVYTRVNLATATKADTLSSGSGTFTGNNLNNPPEFALKFQALEGIDIIGDDAYTSSVREIKGITTIFGKLIPNNFGHIAENDGNYSNTASLILTSVALHGGYSIYDLITSPFFAENNSANIDQGIILFKNGTKNQFEYKSHYAQTQSIIKGLKLASNVYGVSNDDFIAFNINSDNPAGSISQTISSTNITVAFQTSNGAIGFAIDHGNYIDVYVTANSSINISNCNVTKVQTGSYVNGAFSATNTLATSKQISLTGGTLYRIEYNGSSKISSTAWGHIGG